MRLQTPESAILSAVIFDALIIIGLIPLALRRVKYLPMGAAILLRNNLAIYRVGGVLLPAWIRILLPPMLSSSYRALRKPVGSQSSTLKRWSRNTLRVGNSGF